MIKKPLIFFIILLAAGVGVYYFGFYEEKLSYEVAEGLEIKEFSLEGTVLSKTADSIVVETGRVERTAEGNKVIKYQKTITLAPQMQFHTNLGPDMIVAEVLSVEDSMAKLKVGDRAVFYGTGRLDMASSDTVVATKLEVIGMGSVQ